jgi:hypothetical protein
MTNSYDWLIVTGQTFVFSCKPADLYECGKVTLHTGAPARVQPAVHLQKLQIPRQRSPGPGGTTAQQGAGTQA